MKKSFQTTLILFGTLVALGAWYYFFELNIRPEQEKEEKNSKRFTQVEKEDVQMLSISRKRPDSDEYSTIDLKKVGSEWKIVSPVEDAADDNAIMALLSSVTTATSQRTVEEKPKTLEPFGLDKPEAKVALQKDSNSPKVEILLGKNTPVGSNTYAKMAGEEAVHLATASLKTAIEKDLFALRNKKLSRIGRFDAEEMTISGKVSLLMQKDKEGDWNMAREGLPADSNKWTKTLNAVTDLRAKAVAMEDGKSQLAQFGLAKPLFRVELKSSKYPESVQLDLGTQDKKFYAKHRESNRIYEVNKALFDKLGTPVSEYYDLSIAKFNRFKVNKIKLEGAEAIELRKEGSTWSFAGAPKKTVDETKVDSLLTALQDMKATKFKPGKGPLGNTTLVIQLFSPDSDKEKSEKKDLALSFGTPSGKEVVGSREGMTQLFEIKVDDFKKINLREKDFLKAEETAEKKKEKTG